MRLLQGNRACVFVCLLLHTLGVWGIIPPKMRRVCRLGPNNSLFFYSSTDTCQRFKGYYIWGRNGNSGPFTLIDSLGAKSAVSYLHSGANPTGTTTNWSYFIQFLDSCTATGSFSDTMGVDDTPPDTLFLDSVSVDIATNMVKLGWRKSPTPDFFRYLLFYDSLGIKWVEVVPGVLRDTFATDNNSFSDPRLRPLKYDITSIDSCNTRPQVFNIKPHITIYLSGNVDTCKKIASLQWTHYVGWPKIRNYYIFRQINAGGFKLIDSLSGILNNYQLPVELGEVNDFFVRANKDTSLAVSSTSAQLTLQTRSRKEPENTRLINISAVNPDANEIKADLLIVNDEEAKQINIWYNTSLNRDAYSNIAAFSSLGQSGSISDVFVSPDKKDALYFRLESVNLCNVLYENIVVMPQMALKVVSMGNENMLSWNRYFGWPNGVSRYRIYRGTDDGFGKRSYILIDSVPYTDSTYTDSAPPDNVGSFGLCYFVEAVQALPSPEDPGSAKSFSDCIIEEMVVFVPNAFRPEGVNKTFRPEGSFIDYTSSSMEIFDRWGGLLISKKDIRGGWDGKDASGNTCIGGVYYYKFNIISPDGKKQTKTGFVTLLN
ncbi:MAG: gliding motility-associated C-terminal domain-containing protein [Bacteroidota bacterium]|jgi:gliding motility-associated-like protein